MVSDLFQDRAQFALGVGYTDEPAQALIAVARFGKKATCGVVVSDNPRRHCPLTADVCFQLLRFGGRRTPLSRSGSLANQISGTGELTQMVGDRSLEKQRVRQLEVVAFLTGDQLSARQKAVSRPEVAFVAGHHSGFAQGFTQQVSRPQSLSGCNSGTECLPGRLISLCGAVYPSPLEKDAAPLRRCGHSQHILCQQVAKETLSGGNAMGAEVPGD